MIGISERLIRKVVRNSNDESSDFQFNNNNGPVSGNKSPNGNPSSMNANLQIENLLATSPDQNGLPGPLNSPLPPADPNPNQAKPRKTSNITTNSNNNVNSNTSNSTDSTNNGVNNNNNNNSNNQANNANNTTNKGNISNLKIQKQVSRNSAIITSTTSDSSSLFSREEVKVPKLVASSLSKELGDWGLLRGPNSTRSTIHSNSKRGSNIYNFQVQHRPSLLLSPRNNYTNGPTTPSVSTIPSANNNDSPPLSPNSTNTNTNTQYNNNTNNNNVSTSNNSNTNNPNNNTTNNSNSTTPSNGPNSVPTYIGSGVGPLLVLKIYAFVGDMPLRITIKGTCTVHKVIEGFILQYLFEKRTPVLPSMIPEYWEMRMLDDEEDGTPDEDMPAFDRTRDIHDFAVDAVALVADPSFDQNNNNNTSNYEISKNNRESDSRTHSRNSSFEYTGGRQGRTLSMDINRREESKGGASNRFFVKVHVAPQESHILNVTNDMALLDLLPLIAKKRASTSSVMPPELFRFQYLDDSAELDMSTTLSTIATDELRLVSRLTPQSINPQSPHHRTASTSQINQSGLSGLSPNEVTPESFTFTLETASQYSEYKVVKTNDKGKRQNRILGIDKSRMYNKHCDDGKKKGRLSFEVFQVSRAYRPITSIISCTLMATKPNSFQVQYAEKGKLVTREYETETRLECAEIVAKLRFLMSHSNNNSKEEKS